MPRTKKIEKPVEEQTYSEHVRRAIKAILETTGKTKEEIWELKIISQPTWYDRMSDPGTFRTREVERIAKFLGVEPKVLLNPYICAANSIIYSPDLLKKEEKNHGNL